MADSFSVPYAREELEPGIVHFGVGNFHRSHQAMYLDLLHRRGLAREWGVCGVGLLPADTRARDALERQDCLYTLVERSPDGTVDARTVGSIVEYLYAPDDPEAVLRRLAAPTTRLVTLTITEGGYNVDGETGEFDATDPEVAADLASPSTPRTVFGYVVEGLRRRREAGLAPYTVASCDNVEGNGDVASRSFTAYAGLLDPELGDWMSEVSFPNSMVDRITPATGEAERAFVRDVVGVEDAWPVVAESFAQWVIEDDFSLGRPPLEHVGVQVVPDVRPYELMKLRLLNAGHQLIAHLGQLLGYRYAHEAAGDPEIVSMLRSYFDTEGGPTLAPVPGVDLDAYKDTLVERFSSPHTLDTLARLATDASDRIEGWVLPVVRDRLRCGERSPLCAAVVAAWARSAELTTAPDAPFALIDRRAALVREAAERSLAEPLGFLRDRSIFGGLADEPLFAEDYLEALHALRDSGPRGLLSRARSRG